MCTRTLRTSILSALLSSAAALLPPVGFSPPAKSHRAPAPSAKFVGAALAAAFASKDDGTATDSEEQLSLAETEERVIQTIRDVIDAGVGKPRQAWSALGEFGKASGTLAQTWLTPQQVESVVAFWGCGCTALARDLRRGKLRFGDLKAAGWFSLLALNTFPWTPLLVPLVARAVNSTDGSAAFVPPSFGDARLSALMRLRGDAGLGHVDTPQTIDEGVSFFADGGRMLARDVRRGKLTAYGDELSAYGWFLLLAFSTFPLTPLLLPVIDKRRDGPQADYVPASFRSGRLSAYARLRASRLAPASAPAEVIAACAQRPPGERPRPDQLLAAIVALPSTPAGRGRYLDALAGGGAPGRRWRLVYTAGKDAVRSARQRRNRPGQAGGATERSWLDNVGEAALPWTRLKHGLFVDGVVTAVQRFDSSSWENENGVFAVLGAEWLQLTVKGPFKWPQPERRAVCGFQPTQARVQLGGWAREWQLEPTVVSKRAEASSTPPFDEARVTELPFFKFLLVDERVAVAQGRSGGVAVWARVDDV